ncbi:hypothetical protein ES707_21671 [subsurface metagenome]
MKRRNLLKLVVLVSLVVVLATGVPLLSGCFPGKPAAAPPEAPPEAQPTAPPAAAPEPVTIKIGFDAPLTGEAAAWGLPGLYGTYIWIDWYNEAGGITLSDGTPVLIEMLSYDNEYISDKALTGARKLILEDGVSMVMMLGGHTTAAAIPFMTEQQVITTTQVASDLNPTTPYLIATGEIFPLHQAVVSEWWVENCGVENPRVAQLNADDEIGIPCKAIISTSVESHGGEMVYNKFCKWDEIDFAPYMSAMLAADPDILALVLNPPQVTLMLEQAYLQGWGDAPIYTSTLDMLAEAIDRTSVEFVSGTVMDFPDFDDPQLSPTENRFYAEYIERYPGQWSAVSWEYYVALDQIVHAVKICDSVEPMAIFEAMKSGPMPHPFGEGIWWGAEFFGIDNALASPWPACQVNEDGKRIIMEFRDQMDWYARNQELNDQWFESYDWMWYQRMGLTKEEALQKYGLSD